MIPRANVLEWRQMHPWQGDDQVEQDLLLSRALIELFLDETLSDALAFRGGTALHKLCLQPPRRYSEDIDLVQVQAGPIGPIYDAVQKQLNSWLGKPLRKRGTGVATLVYRTESTGPSVIPIKLKIEINTREHFAVNDFVQREFEVVSRWYTGKCMLTTYTLEELLGTKMRALFQRRKGRDLFDLWLGLTEAKADSNQVVTCFQGYMDAEGCKVSRQEYMENLAEKLEHPGFLSDIVPLLVPGTIFDMNEAAETVRSELVERLS